MKRDRKQPRGLPKPAPVDPTRQWHLAVLIGLAVVTALAYSNSFRSAFIVDNRVLLLDPRIRAMTAENIHLILTKDYWYGLAGSGLYRPLSSLSYLFNYVVLGDAEQPAGYHWVNLLLHVANVALVYALGLRLFARMERAAALAAIWGLHPILTESVTNIIGRSDLLSTFGVLGGLLAHIHAASALGRRRAAWLAVLGLAGTIAIFSKESGIVLLVIMAIYDLTFRESAAWRTRAAGYLVLLVPLCVFWYARSRVFVNTPGMHIGFGDNPLSAASFWASRLTAIKILGKYLWLLLWPAQLSCDYSYNQVPLVNFPPSTWEDWQAPIALILYLAAAGFAILGYRSRRLVFFFVAFFFATLAPTSNILVLIGTIMAERLLYLPSIAFAGCLVMAVFAWDARRRGIALLAAICLLYAVRTYARNSDWLDDQSLWRSAVTVAPNSFKTHMAYASSLVTPANPRLDEAITEIEKTFAIVNGLPDELNNPAPYIDAGSYYGQKGESLSIRKPDGTWESTPQSLMWYGKALETLLRARRIEAVNNRDNRRIAQAEGRTYKEHGWYELYLGLAGVYLRLSQPAKALEALEHGRRFRPTPEFFEKAADAHSALGDPRQAAVDMAAAILMDPREPRMPARLAYMYQQTDPAGCAVRPGTQSLNTECPVVHNDFCTASQSVAAVFREAGMETAAENTRQNAIANLHCPPN